MADLKQREQFEAWYVTDAAQEQAHLRGWNGIAWAAWQASRRQALEEAAKVAQPIDTLIAESIRGLDGQEQESRHG